MEDDETDESITAIDFASDLNALGENPGNVILERIATLPGARQIAFSKTDPTIVYMSTMSDIWVLILDDDNSKVTKGPIQLIGNLETPQGIDTALGLSSTTTLYVSTGGTLPFNRGNAILEIEDVDSFAYDALGVATNANDVTYPFDGSNCDIVKTVVKDFTKFQVAHAWRSLRVHPSGSFLIVSVGADCNWSKSCTDDGKDELHTTLVRIGLLPESERGQVSVAARGIRNSVAFHFDDQENLMFTSMGSDMAAGIPGATSSNNIPDCTVEVLEFNNDTVIEPIPQSNSGLFDFFLFELLGSILNQAGSFLFYFCSGDSPIFS